ncbi:MAG: MATE family efflux transporter [Christensenellales bacterium]
MSERPSFKQKFIGDRAFYRSVAAIVVPIIIQMSVSNVVNLLDNMMVGQLGTAALSGVAICSQMIFVFYLCLFGGLSGPGIFGAQFFGAGNMEGVRDAFRLKLWISLIVILVALGVFLIGGESLVRLYLTGDGDPQEAQSMLRYALDYLHIMLLSFLPFALTTIYAGTLREGGETMLPMKAGIAAVVTNLIGNWLLIYGNLGFPQWGVKGAAIATVISRFVELAIILLVMHRSRRFAFMHGVYRKLKVSLSFVKTVLRKGAPLLANEFLWSLGMATLTQIYSVRGLSVLAGMNIANTINNLFNVVFLSMGNAVAVMIGQSLGANNMHKAKGDVWRLMILSVGACVVIGGSMALLSPFFPRLYKTSEEVRHLASAFMLTMALYMPTYAVSHCCFFTMRSGGSTLLTFLFDAAYMWVVNIPLALALAHLTGIPIIYLFPLCEAAGLFKMALGIFLVNKGIWARNIVHAM